jgi:hypothetical protein
MRAALIALMLMFGSQVEAECCNLCDFVWVHNATVVDLQAELDTGVNVMGWLRGETGLFITTP